MFRYPDKPASAPASIIQDLKPGEWLAQFKHDGWRCLIERTPNACTFTSRTNTPIPISPDFARRVSEAFQALPAGCVIDSEWMGRRDGQPEGLVLFDLLHDGARWLDKIDIEMRFSLLLNVMVNCDPVPGWQIVSVGYAPFQAFYDFAQKEPGVEGIVLKRRGSGLVLSTRGSAINPGWIKAKWR